jgi:dTMP kinase
LTYFITFEGLDGCGKSTHLGLLAERLEQLGESCCRTHEPGGTEVGQEIRQIFLDPKRKALDGLVELMLVFASRRQHLLEVIDPALAAGQHVLCDRFTDSTRAYQGFARGVDQHLVDQVDQVATGSRQPDRTVLLDLPADVAHQRGQSRSRHENGTIDRIDAEALDFYHRVRDGFLCLAREQPDRIRLVEVHEDPDVTQRRVRAAVADLFPALLTVPGQTTSARAGGEAP